MRTSPSCVCCVSVCNLYEWDGTDLEDFIVDSGTWSITIPDAEPSTPYITCSSIGELIYDGGALPSRGYIALVIRADTLGQKASLKLYNPSHSVVMELTFGEVGIDSATSLSIKVDGVEQYVTLPQRSDLSACEIPEENSSLSSSSLSSLSSLSSFSSLSSPSSESSRSSLSSQSSLSSLSSSSSSSRSSSSRSSSSSSSSNGCISKVLLHCLWTPTYLRVEVEHVDDAASTEIFEGIGNILPLDWQPNNFSIGAAPLTDVVYFEQVILERGTSNCVQETDCTWRNDLQGIVIPRNIGSLIGEWNLTDWNVNEYVADAIYIGNPNASPAIGSYVLPKGISITEYVHDSGYVAVARVVTFLESLSGSWRHESSLFTANVEVRWYSRRNFFPDSIDWQGELYIDGILVDTNQLLSSGASVLTPVQGTMGIWIGESEVEAFVGGVGFSTFVPAVGFNTFSPPFLSGTGAVFTDGTVRVESGASVRLFHRTEFIRAVYCEGPIEESSASSSPSSNSSSLSSSSQSSSSLSSQSSSSPSSVSSQSSLSSQSSSQSSLSSQSSSLSSQSSQSSSSSQSQSNSSLSSLSSLSSQSSSSGGVTGACCDQNTNCCLGIMTEAECHALHPDNNWLAGSVCTDICDEC